MRDEQKTFNEKFQRKHNKTLVTMEWFKRDRARMERNNQRLRDQVEQIKREKEQVERDNEYLRDQVGQIEREKEQAEKDKEQVERGASIFAGTKKHWRQRHEYSVAPRRGGSGRAKK
jgi:chromosome segregation ATPase